MQKSTTDVLQDGLLSGVAGYALISVYFALSNLVAGLPALHTIEALGEALFGGTNPGQMIAYNGLHLAVFLVLGVIAALLIREVELHPAAIRPILESPGLEFRPMIDRDGARPLALSQDAIQYLTHQRSRHPKSGL